MVILRKKHDFWEIFEILELNNELYYMYFFFVKENCKDFSKIMLFS